MGKFLRSIKKLHKRPKQNIERFSSDVETVKNHDCAENSFPNTREDQDMTSLKHLNSNLLFEIQISSFASKEFISSDPIYPKKFELAQFLSSEDLQLPKIPRQSFSDFRQLINLQCHDVTRDSIPILPGFLFVGFDKHFESLSQETHSHEHVSISKTNSHLPLVDLGQRNEIDFPQTSTPTLSQAQAYMQSCKKENATQGLSDVDSLSSDYGDSISLSVYKNPKHFKSNTSSFTVDNMEQSQDDFQYDSCPDKKPSFVSSLQDLNKPLPSTQKAIFQYKEQSSDVSTGIFSGPAISLKSIPVDEIKKTGFRGFSEATKPKDSIWYNERQIFTHRKGKIKVPPPLNLRGLSALEDIRIYKKRDKKVYRKKPPPASQIATKQSFNSYTEQSPKVKVYPPNTTKKASNPTLSIIPYDFNPEAFSTIQSTAGLLFTSAITTNLDINSTKSTSTFYSFNDSNFLTANQISVKISPEKYHDLNFMLIGQSQKESKFNESTPKSNSIVLISQIYTPKIYSNNPFFQEVQANRAQAKEKLAGREVYNSGLPDKQDLKASIKMNQVIALQCTSNIEILHIGNNKENMCMTRHTKTINVPTHNPFLKTTSRRVSRGVIKDPESISRVGELPPDLEAKSAYNSVLAVFKNGLPPPPHCAPFDSQEPRKMIKNRVCRQSAIDSTWNASSFASVLELSERCSLSQSESNDSQHKIGSLSPIKLSSSSSLRSTVSTKQSRRAGIIFPIHSLEKSLTLTL